MRTLTLSLLLLVSLAAPAAARDWNNFRGPTRDGKSAETKLLDRWPDGGPSVLWSATGLGEGYSSASIADGRVYLTGRVGTDGFLHCLSVEGRRLWQVRYGEETAGRGRFPGARSTPTIDEGRAYFMSGTGVVYCHDAATGKQLWQLDILERFGGRNLQWAIAESLLVDGNKLICTPGGPGAGVVALDKATGKLIWKCAAISDRAAYCSPLLVERGGTRLLVTLTARAVVGVELETGKLLWRQPYGNRSGIHPVTPVLSGDHLLATSGYGEGAVVLELSRDGKQVKQVWRERTLDTHHGGLVAIDGYVYGTSDRRPPRQMMCIELKTGKELYRTRNPVGKGSIISAAGMLYVYGENGVVALARATPKGFELRGQFRVDFGERQHWAHPAISDGRLYIRHGGTMKVYRIRAGASKPAVKQPKPAKKKVDFY